MNVHAAPIRFYSEGIQRTGEPVTRGIPFPRGSLKHLQNLVCKDPAGFIVALQVRGLERWGDGSWKWVLCDWRVSVTDEATYLIEITETANPTTQISEPATAQNQAVISEGTLRLSDVFGKPFDYSPEPKSSIEEAGTLRFAICKTGYFSKDGKRVARVTQRISSYPGTNVNRVQLTLQNFRKAVHPGGLWDLGDAGSIQFKSFTVTYPLAGNTPVSGSVCIELGQPSQPLRLPFELYQDSSGGQNWRSTNHMSRTRQIPLQFQGYRLRNGDFKADGKRATPLIGIRKGDTEVGIGIPAFWQNFPKAINISESELTLGLFPEQILESHELQGGEQKTHVFYIATGKDSITAEPLAWTRKPLKAMIDPSWMERSGAISYLTAPGTDEAAYQSLVDAAIEGIDTFEIKREVIDEYGWRHFGDIYGDHEAILHTESGPNPRISHYNNQYDPIAGFAYQWLRHGDSRWYAMMEDLAFHVRDIDLYNTDEDKAAYNHGLFWHTYHYVDADTGTHRSYPKNGRVPPNNKLVPGGGPGSEQNYAHGLLLHYYLTGDHASKESCVGMAQWVIDMDDGSKTVFRFLSKADTGVASASRSPDYQGPGRGSGNSLATLLDGYRLTEDRKFLQKAERIIRRVIHPADNIQRLVGMTHDGKNYVDAENRWFYVMFLQSLGKYLDLKAEKGDLDETYAYARACLLHYARWMLENEYPYLSRPEILEYPTETWVAQDMRKCEVFQFAALHAEPSERAKFEAKAEEYHRYVVNTLPGMPTKTLCRPVVLLLSYGWSRFWHRRNTDAVRPAPKMSPKEFPAKHAFVPQKVIAMKRAKMIVAGSGILGLAAVVILAVVLFKS